MFSQITKKNWPDIFRYCLIIVIGLAIIFEILNYLSDGLINHYFNLIYCWQFSLVIFIIYFFFKQRSWYQKLKKLTFFPAILYFGFLLYFILLIISLFLRFFPSIDSLPLDRQIIAYFFWPITFLIIWLMSVSLISHLPSSTSVNLNTSFPNIFTRPFYYLKKYVRFFSGSEMWIFLFLIIFGFIIRLYRLGTLSLWWDELITGTIVTRIMEKGLPIDPAGLEYYWRGMAFHYFTALFTWLFANNEFWLRFPDVLFGMGTIILSYFYARRLNRTLSIFVLIFLVLSPYNLEYSRFARFYMMNAFLFLLSIHFVWQGMFLNRRLYRWLSLLTFLIMVYTVQLGMVFLALIGAWIIHFICQYFFTRPRITAHFRGNLANWLVVMGSAFIFWQDNYFFHHVKLNNNLKLAYIVSADVVPPVDWSYLQWPKWSLINFYNSYHLPIFLTLIGLSFALILFFYNLKKNRPIQFISFLSLSLLLVVLMYEVGSRDVTGARIYLFTESLIVIISFWGLWQIIKLAVKSRLHQIIAQSLILLVLLLSIRPYFWQIITLQYGDDVSKDPFRNTEVAAYRSDYKTTFLYLLDHLKPQDILICVMADNYYYLPRSADYIFNQNARWNTNSLVDKQGNFLQGSSILINTVNDLNQIIYRHADRHVWLLVNGGSINILNTTHVRNDFLNFLSDNQNQVVYNSPDKYSQILLFN